jgi:hypothetical protein
LLAGELPAWIWCRLSDVAPKLFVEEVIGDRVSLAAGITGPG